MTARHCGQAGCTCPDPLPEIRSIAELARLPQLSVVQFRGPGLGAKNRLVWQLDDEWFSAGDSWSMPTAQVPPEAFPAVLLWAPPVPAATPIPVRCRTPRGRSRAC